MQVLQHFEKIAQIPHCTFQTEKLQEFLVEYCKDKGFKVKVDKVGNIHAYKGNPGICLQSHYDMVCVGDAPKIEIVNDGKYISAKNSSLGADNGIGVSIMMQMMAEFENLEVIFTNDEEMGLMGASDFNEEIKSPRVLNLDSEEDDKVIIGCAGGVDVFARKKIERTRLKGDVYEVIIEGLPGGHSGIEIHKNIPNSIKEIAKFLKQNNAKIIDLQGGERRNSIPCGAKALVICENKLESKDFIKVKFIENKECEVLQNDDLLNLLCSFSQGVRAYNCELNLPDDSINLSVLTMKNDEIEIEFFPRSMSLEGLERTKFETKVLCESFGFSVEFENQTYPWKPEISEFSEHILEFLKKQISNAKLDAVHAGLECGVFLAKNPKLKVASIGPNIFSPHSVNEKCEIKSIEIIENVVRDIVKFYN